MCSGQRTSRWNFEELMCISCGKPRIFFSKEKIVDKKLFVQGLESIEFECGQPLFSSGEKAYQKEFAEKVITNKKRLRKPFGSVLFQQKIWTHSLLQVWTRHFERNQTNRNVQKEAG